jgi:hypothetical protein
MLGIELIGLSYELTYNAAIPWTVQHCPSVRHFSNAVHYRDQINHIELRRMVRIHTQDLLRSAPRRDVSI